MWPSRILPPLAATQSTSYPKSLAPMDDSTPVTFSHHRGSEFQDNERSVKVNIVFSKSRMISLILICRVLRVAVRGFGNSPFAYKSSFNVLPCSPSLRKFHSTRRVVPNNHVTNIQSSGKLQQYVPYGTAGHAIFIATCGLLHTQF